MKKTKPTFHQKSKDEGRKLIDRQNTKWSEEISGECEHNWQPISFVFETQLLDENGRVCVKQPDLTNGRVYCVCMKCCSHTYIETGWVGYYINSPDLLEDPDEDEIGLEDLENDTSLPNEI